MSNTNNPFARMWYAFVDLVNKIFPDRSSESLLDETIESGKAAFKQSFEELKSSGGDINVLMRELGTQKANLAAATSNRDALVREYATAPEGPKKIAIQRQLAYAQRICETSQSVVDQMEQTVNSVKLTQESAEASLVISESERNANIAEAQANVAMEKLYKTLERVSDTQLTAAGHLSSPNIKNHSQELADRAAKQQGRAEAGQRIAQQMVGNKIGAPLSAQEQSLLERALNAAPGKTTSKPDEQSAQQSEKGS